MNTNKIVIASMLNPIVEHVISEVPNRKKLVCCTNIFGLKVELQVYSEPSEISGWASVRTFNELAAAIEHYNSL